ncbi:methyltransferase domain-containing protein (plasmid) [Azospirillum sp. TSA2s]|uniref:class I SAM-dependent methyltransferase n=1 Tax=Azospirillum sp. TSA2s TaxID=709810 RepID=UPI0010A9F0DD|nr:class I SAM-dependent methyltransferase [Azospirillum sp. TSA2s]QCG93006.1 methyltransferase domain-containing protein [Azospirillum sp. TSA2s]
MERPADLPSPVGYDPGSVDYDESWNTRWHDMRRYGPTGRHLRRIMADLVGRLDYDSVLDVGCGQGDLLESLMRLKPQARYAGVDFSASAVAGAKRRVPTAELDQLDLAAGALDRRFDLVVCTDVVEHIEDDRAAIVNLAAMTGKYLVVTTLQGRMREYEKLVGHYRNYKPGELEAKIRDAGLVVERVVQWGFPFYSPFYRDLFSATGINATQGTYGPVRRLLAHAIYGVFCLNAWNRGDYICVLARRPG